MKPLFTILLISLTITTKAQNKSITLVISYIHREDGNSEAIARRGWQIWKTKCNSLPEHWTLGAKLIALPGKKADTCFCIFKRLK